MKIGYQENLSQVYSPSIETYQKYLWGVHLLTETYFVENLYWDALRKHFWNVYFSTLSWFWMGFFLGWTYLFSFSIIYFTKHIVIHTHLCFMSIVEFSMSLLVSLLSKWTTLLLQLYPGFMFELSIKQIFLLHSYLRWIFTCVTFVFSLLPRKTIADSKILLSFYLQHTTTSSS